MPSEREPAWKCKIKSGNLMERVRKHAEGEIEMTPSQLQAASLFLKKVIPDLSSVAHKGDDDPASPAIRHALSVTLVRPNANT